MPDEPRVQELLAELLDREATPEEVCGACPELLPIVRERWRQIRRVTIAAYHPGQLFHQVGVAARTAEHHVVDGARVYARAGHQFPDHVRAEVGRVGARQAAAAAGDRGTHGVDDEGLEHRCLPLLSC